MSARVSSKAEPAKINPDQAAILRAALPGLKAVTEKGKADIHEAEKLHAARRLSFPALKEKMVQSLAAATDIVATTRGLFLESSKSAGVVAAARAFFDGLLAEYTEVSGKIQTLEFPGYPPVRERTLLALETPVLAYQRVASEGSLTFNLVVESTPPIAALSYRRTGEPYTQNPDPTDTTIWNLPYAIYIIRVQKPPEWADQEKPHDPFRDPNHKIHFDLARK